jgi:FeS assembly protein IscX
MNGFSQSGKLYWESTYEIVLALMEQYPSLDIDAVGLDELNEYIVTLPNFADDPRLANEAILSEILREWYEEVNP